MIKRTHRRPKGKKAPDPTQPHALRTIHPGAPFWLAAGLSLVHVMCMEICDQSELGPVIAGNDSFMQTRNDKARKIITTQ